MAKRAGPLWLRALTRLVAIVPWSWLRPLGSVLAFIAYDVLRIRRAQVVAAIERAGLGDAKTGRACLRGLGRSALELLWITGRPEADVAALVDVADFPRFVEARAKGRGVIVATAHTGNWDLTACACAARTPLTIVTKRLRSPRLDAWWQGARAGRGVDLVFEEASVVRALLDKLRDGGSVALLVDQDPERTTSVAEGPFLGEIALHDTLPATLSARSGAPIVVALGRVVDNRHTVAILDVLAPPARPSAAWVERTTLAIAAHVDSFVREDPSCWLWLHRRWKTRRTHAERS